MSGSGMEGRGLKEAGRSAVNAVLERVGRGVGKMQERRPLSYDLLESDDAYLVVFDAPGATRSDIQVRFRDGAVEVRIDRFREFREGFEMRFPGRGLALDGEAELPAGAAIDPTGASATLTERGTLQVRLPKSEEGRDVEVREEGTEGIALDEDEADAETDSSEEEE